MTLHKEEGEDLLDNVEEWEQVDDDEVIVIKLNIVFTNRFQPNVNKFKWFEVSRELVFFHGHLLSG